MEVVKDEYKIYDSDSKDIFIKDSEFVENWRVLGVVQLTDVSVIAQCFTKLQLDIMKCIKEIKKYKVRYNFSLVGNKMCILGRAFETCRYDYIIKDRQKFDKAVTKYCINNG